MDHPQAQVCQWQHVEVGGPGGIAMGWAGFRALLAFRPERLARIGAASLS